MERPPSPPLARLRPAPRKQATGLCGGEQGLCGEEGRPQNTAAAGSRLSHGGPGGAWGGPRAHRSQRPEQSALEVGQGSPHPTEQGVSAQGTEDAGFGFLELV